MQYTELSELNRALWYLDAGDAAPWEVDGAPVAPPDSLGLYVGAGVDNSAVVELMRGSPPPYRVSMLDSNVSVADARTPRGPSNSGRRSPSVRDSSRRLATSGSASVGSASASAANKAAARGVFGYTTSKLEFRKAAPTPDAFPRQPVPVCPPPAPASSEAEGSSVGLIAAAIREGKGGVGAVTLRLCVYLPNREPMTVEVRAGVSVNDVIVATLKQHSTERRRPALRAGSNCYELRLHEEDGYPDEDFPALDRSRKISNFAQGGVHEYCLCEIPGMKPTVTTSTRQLMRMQSIASVKCVKIIMPEQSLVPYTVMRLSPTLRAADVVRSLAHNRKYRLSIYHHEYVLQLGKDDQVRLRRSTPNLSPRDLIESLEVEELQLARRQYADSPTSQEVRRKREPEAQDEQKTDSHGAAQFGHNLLSAAAYKEWTVIKVNKRGRRQVRIMGIDLTKICNKKVSKKRLLAAETVQRPERVISDITELRLPDTDGTVFFITFRESAFENITIEYEANSAADRAAIVAKLEYILNLNHVGDRVVRPKPTRSAP